MQRYDTTNKDIVIFLLFVFVNCNIIRVFEF